MQNSYSIQELIDALDDVVNSATPVPFGKKSMVDVGKISEIISDMRMALPMEIRQAQKVVEDKNSIVGDAEREAESIIRKAEERRNQLIDESEILKEARRRATEVIGSAEAQCSDLRASTDAFADKMLMRIEELLQRDLNDIRILRQNKTAPVSQQSSVQPPEKPGV